jgi:hypothetical protein
MNHLAFILLLISAISINAAHHCNEFTSNISTPRKFWIATRRGRRNHDETELVHQKKMHSWTGVKGIDHQSKERDEDETRSTRAHKKVKLATSDPIRRHDMHSFLGIEGIDHQTECNTLSEPQETPVAKHARRRLDRSRTPNMVKPVKHTKVKVIQTLNKDVPGERIHHLSTTIFFNHV